MIELEDLPDHVLHTIVSFVIDATRFKGWQLSLRQVNRQFNEAVLHVCFVQRRFFADGSWHSLDCKNPCFNLFCRKDEVSRLKYAYAFRFNFQNLLTVRNLSEEVTTGNQILRQWKEALTILQTFEITKQLDLQQLQFYSTCTANPIFNTACSAILSHAIESYFNTRFLTASTLGDASHRGSQNTAFWVALTACVLGDLPLFEHYFKRLPLPVEGLSNPGWPEDLPHVQQYLALSRVAVKHGSLQIANHLLGTHPNLVSERSFHTVLSEAIFSQNPQTLKEILRHTPNLPDLLTKSLARYQHLLPRSESSSETIRLLTRHFTPLSAGSRAWLIVHSCAVDDLTLLQEFSSSGSLFSHQIEDGGGQIPTFLHVAIRCGNIDTVRYLLAHGIAETRSLRVLTTPIELSLYFNQIESYRELRRRLDPEMLEPYFQYIALADNSEDILGECLSELITEYGKDFIFDPRENETDGMLIPSPMQRALVNAIQRLRPGNVHFLLSVGARVSPGQFLNQHSWDLGGEPYEIPWPYFNKNRDAFRCTQEVLNTFGMAKLRILL